MFVRIKQAGFAVIELIILLALVAIVVGGFLYILHSTKTNKANINKAFQNKQTQAK